VTTALFVCLHNAGRSQMSHRDEIRQRVQELVAQLDALRR
jgi:protein-tyrosine-phosphatase